MYNFNLSNPEGPMEQTNLPSNSQGSPSRRYMILFNLRQVLLTVFLFR
jgi:hypothetical protein